MAGKPGRHPRAVLVDHAVLVESVLAAAEIVVCPHTTLRRKLKAGRCVVNGYTVEYVQPEGKPEAKVKVKPQRASTGPLLRKLVTHRLGVYYG